MLLRANRLKRSKLFPTTLASGRMLGQNASMIVLGLPRSFQSDTPTRYGFVVSKKVHNKAHERNKVKRRLREAVRTLILAEPRLGHLPHISVVIIARKGILESTYGQLQQSLKLWLEKA